MFSHLLALSLWITVALCSLQYPLAASRSDEQFLLHSEHNIDPPIALGSDLRALDASRFTTLAHPAFPQHSVRIKSMSDGFCDPDVRGYTGYIDIQARHLFFYFFESRRDPDNDPVILWTNGGPGCSSSLGLFMELGPCRINDANGTKYNPHSWNENANIFFIDQPIGVGFSYAEYGETVSSTEEAAKDISAFVNIFFETFSKFKGRPFHMAGESYGGRYIPVFAAEVWDSNLRAKEEGRTPINLTSVLIGNGMTDEYRMIGSYYDMTCTAASVPPILSVSTCVRMKQARERCLKWAKEGCIDTFEAMNCKAASEFCSVEILSPFFASGMNPYDMSKVCEGELMETLCYPVTRHINNFLDREDVRRQLGVHPSIGNFTSCSDSVGYAFIGNLDSFRPTVPYVSNLLERGVDVLIYVGSYDWICNWVGNERFTLALEWSGQKAFNARSLREWKVDGTVAGKTRSAKGLTFATVTGAGHMVPYDKPMQALELVKRWLAKEAL